VAVQGKWVAMVMKSDAMNPRVNSFLNPSATIGVKAVGRGQQRPKAIRWGS
jgi:hypothetical protein